MLKRQKEIYLVVRSTCRRKDFYLMVSSYFLSEGDTDIA